jgi:hypothetical protein
MTNPNAMHRTRCIANVMHPMGCMSTLNRSEGVKKLKRFEAIFSPVHRVQGGILKGEHRRNR